MTTSAASLLQDVTADALAALIAGGLGKCIDCGRPLKSKPYQYRLVKRCMSCHWKARNALRHESVREEKS